MDAPALYIIATPIGNLDDITFRAVATLRAVDAIYCEDTRHTGRLLAHYDIRGKTVRSLHAHSADRRIQEACERIAGGMSVAYCTDSGTPGISDPGHALVEAAVARDLPVIPIPGASAVTALFSVCGFTEKRMLFAGFPGKKEGKIRRELEELSRFEGVILFYESPYRVEKLVQMLAEYFPGASVVIGREMTKRFEEFYRGTLEPSGNGLPPLNGRGEFAIALRNRPKNP